MVSTLKAGRSNKLYYNNRSNLPPFDGSGTLESPALVLIDRVGDVDRPNAKNSTEVDLRSSHTSLTVMGNKHRTVTFMYYKKSGANDEVFNVLLFSFESNQPLEIFLAEDVFGGDGTLYDHGPFIVSEFAKSEPVGGVDSYSVTLSVAEYDFLYEANLEASFLGLPQEVGAMESPDNALVGEDYELSVFFLGATGYQWQVNTGGGWENIDGATLSGLTLEDITLGGTGSYRCVASNEFGSTNSSVLVLTVFPPAPILDSDLIGGEAIEGSLFSFTAYFTGAVSYAWSFNDGSGVWQSVGGDFSTYDRDPVNAASVGLYRCLATNPYGSTYSNSAELIMT